MYLEMETAFSMLSYARYITPLSSISIYAFLEFSIFCITLSCIEKATLSSFGKAMSIIWQGKEHGQIIQPVANSLNVTTRTQFNLITYYLIGHL